jgi:hypothetical protein
LGREISLNTPSWAAVGFLLRRITASVLLDENVPAANYNGILPTAFNGTPLGQHA